MNFPLSLANQAEQQLQQLAQILCQHFPEQYDYVSMLEQIKQDKEQLNRPIGQLYYAIQLSEFVKNTLEKQPHFLHQLWQQPIQLSDCDNYHTRLKQRLDFIQEESAFYKALRDFRYQEMTKLSLCQSLNFGTVEGIFVRLSQLAESLIINARDWLYKQACAEMGTPSNAEGIPQQLYILGMGKLGGQELNFSSDIDLIFTYPEQGETIGARRAIDNAKFFTRLGQRLINALDQYTADGFVYRTDMRLRPFGESGALALSFAAMEQYYQDQGRDWERYAMIKGRILGADPQDPNVTVLQRLLRPFIYRRYIDFSAIQSLREMKGKIEREVRRRGLTDNIKLGAGGIREIEFIVQVFQLIRGGREISLQQQSLLALLPELKKLELLPPTQVDDLAQAYLFLRRVENVLQAINDQQTQTLPTNPQDQARLILACQCFTYYDAQQQVAIVHFPISNWASFYQQLQHHQQKVRAIFTQLIGNEKEENAAENNLWQDFLETDLEEIQQILQEHHIQPADFADVMQILAQFKTSLNHRVIGVRGREVLTQLLPRLLHQIFAHQHYRTLLPRILTIIEKILSRTTYLELLSENPQALTQLIELCAQSQMIAEQMARHPILLDELLNIEALHNPIPFSQYPSELQQYLLRLPQDDEELFIDGLRQFKNAITLRIAAADILGVLPVMKVSDHLTYLAEAIIESAVNFAWAKITQRFGVPENLQENEKGFLVIGYGKLGGIELGYKSDLDLVFLYQSTANQTVGGKKTIDSRQFYLKLAQKVVSIFSMNTSAGILYDVDMRLRPSGDAGLLGCSLSAFENYQLNEAWTWEKQALVRSRPVFGEPPLREQFNAIRHKVLTQPRERCQLKNEVRDMRDKMAQHIASHQPDCFNLKTDRGGITDIEFIAQYLMLAYAPTTPTLVLWSDNVRIFETMAENNIISAADSEMLKQCYTQLRNQIHHLNLLGKPSLVPMTQFSQERQFIKQFWQGLFGAEENE